MWTALSNRGTQSCSGANECDDKLTWYPSTTDTIGSTVASFFGRTLGQGVHDPVGRRSAAQRRRGRRGRGVHVRGHGDHDHHARAAREYVHN